MGHWALGIGHWAWGIGYWAWGMGHWAWGIGHWAWGMGHWALGMENRKKIRFLHLFTKCFYFCLLTYPCNIVRTTCQWLIKMGGQGGGKEELLTND
jgi:hypothetical protein